ncbi:DNA polymerase III delta subunit [Natranaerovirga pectinivora]|uniref:DNA polymerase III subunit delta n=1 Tax=Natranaerovirga pectinivora TaxID=682400 RepID=A0A4R3MTH5_9FIRM|nr:DNA polymerase III subunit delta [Natranaerovirga pectinivora]TCT16364.1 DNA polymerase III delta subunit [Natranaerovirga pectinivora]
MQNLKKQIKNGELHNLYLFYGKENYIKNLYKKRIKTTLLDEDDIMNYNFFEGKQVRVSDIIDIADTLPFFKEARLIIVENSELFKSGKKDESEAMATYLENIPSSTYLIFVEDEIDKRSKIYKTVQKKGYAVEFNQLNEQEIKQWLRITTNKNNVNINNDVADYFIYTVGMDMATIDKELEKLISYTLGKNEITKEDIDSISTKQIENKIFDMINAIGEKNKEKAIVLYHDLLMLKEPPLRIIFMLVRQFRMLLQVKSLVNAGVNEYEITSKLGLRSFIVKNCIRQVRNFKVERIKEALNDCLEYEGLIKTGRIEDKLGVEIIILKYSI